VPWGAWLVGFRSSKIYTIRPNLYRYPPAGADSMSQTSGNSKGGSPMGTTQSVGGHSSKPENRILLKAVDVPLSASLVR
jgi:hypothetical protein